MTDPDLALSVLTKIAGDLGALFSVTEGSGEVAFDTAISCTSAEVELLLRLRARSEKRCDSCERWDKPTRYFGEYGAHFCAECAAASQQGHGEVGSAQRDDGGVYVRTYYGVPATAGRTITFRGEERVICGFRGQYLEVDRGRGDEMAEVIHPLWKVDYLDGKGDRT